MYFNMVARDADPFGSLNRFLDSRHTQPGTIRKACLMIEDCIVNNRDNLRGFFDKCFPNLLKRIFGYDDFEASWLNMVTKAGKEEDAMALVTLLHPQGKLFAAMQRADAESLIRYIFPVERLPGHTQALLSTAAGRKELESWPQYDSHIMGPELDPSRRPQVFLDVFTYYMFWTAFYVLRGNRAEEGARGTAYGSPATGFGAAGSKGNNGGFGGQHWGLSELKRLGTSFIPGLGHPGGPPLHRHPYYTLLRLYLEHFMPRVVAAAGEGGAGTAQLAGAGPSQLQPSGSRQQLAGLSGSSSYGQVVLNVLLEFWLTDVSEPVPTDAAVPATTADKAAAAAGLPSGGTAGGAAGALVPAGMLSGTGSTGALARQASGGLLGANAASYRALSYQPPSEDLVEALVQLVRYVTVVEPPQSQAGGQGRSPSKLLHFPGHHQQQQQGQGPQAPGGAVPHPAQAKEPWLPEVRIRTSPPVPTSRLLVPQPPGSLLASPSSSPAVQAVSRKLYRFLRRTLTHWPLPSSSSLTPVITLWLSIIAPWAGRAQLSSLQLPSSSSSRGHQDPSSSSSGSGARPLGQQQQQQWGVGDVQSSPRSPGQLQGAGGSRRGPQGSYTPEWRQHVLCHLPFYTVLIPRFLELTYARLSFRSDAAMLDLLLLLETLAASPELVQELSRAEAAYNSYLQSPLRRPSGEYADMLAWAVEQAHDWEAAAAAGAQSRGAMQVDPTYRLFTSDTHSAAFYAVAVLRASEAQLVRPEIRAAVHDAAAVVLPLASVAAEQSTPAGPLAPSYGQHFPRAGNWKDLHYRGDWLKRPIASYEVAPLVRPLVFLSERLNLLIGLTGPLSPEEEEEAPETLGQQAVRWLRRRGFRVSLRFLAERQVLVWIFCLYILYRMIFGAAPVPAAV